MDNDLNIIKNKYFYLKLANQNNEGLSPQYQPLMESLETVTNNFKNLIKQSDSIPMKAFILLDEIIFSKFPPSEKTLLYISENGFIENELKLFLEFPTKRIQHGVIRDEVKMIFDSPIWKLKRASSYFKPMGSKHTFGMVLYIKFYKKFDLNETLSTFEYCLLEYLRVLLAQN